MRERERWQLLTLIELVAALATLYVAYRMHQDAKALELPARRSA